MTSTSDVLGRFWAEAVEMVTTERQAPQNRSRRSWSQRRI